MTSEEFKIAEARAKFAEDLRRSMQKERYHQVQFYGDIFNPDSVSDPLPAGGQK